VIQTIFNLVVLLERQLRKGIMNSEFEATEL